MLHYLGNNKVKSKSELFPQIKNGLSIVSTKNDKNEKEAEQKTKPDDSPTLAEKTKTKEELVASSHIKNDIADNPEILSHISQVVCPENYESPEKKKCREIEVKTVNIFTNIPEIPL